MKTSLLALILIALTSCGKEVYFTDMQEYNTGALIWNWKLISITDPQHKVYDAKDYPDLQDDGIRFLANRTGTRYQGTKLSPYAPQISQIPFTWGIDTTQTDMFYLQAATGAKNHIMVSVNSTHDILTMSVIGEIGYYVYRYRQTSD